MRKMFDAEEEIAASAAYPNIRLFRIDRATAELPLPEISTGKINDNLIRPSHIETVQVYICHHLTLIRDIVSRIFNLWFGINILQYVVLIVF